MSDEVWDGILFFAVMILFFIGLFAAFVLLLQSPLDEGDR